MYNVKNCDLDLSFVSRLVQTVTCIINKYIVNSDMVVVICSASFTGQSLVELFWRIALYIHDPTSMSVLSFSLVSMSCELGVLKGFTFMRFTELRLR